MAGGKDVAASFEREVRVVKKGNVKGLEVRYVTIGLLPLHALCQNAGFDRVATLTSPY